MRPSDVLCRHCGAQPGESCFKHSGAYYRGDQFHAVRHVDSAFPAMPDAHPVATKRHGNPAPDETPQTPIRKGRSS